MINRLRWVYLCAKQKNVSKIACSQTYSAKAQIPFVCNENVYLILHADNVLIGVSKHCNKPVHLTLISRSGTYKKILNGCIESYNLVASVLFSDEAHKTPDANLKDFTHGSHNTAMPS